MFDDQSVLKTEAGEADIEDQAAATPSLEEQLAAANARADENYGKFLLAVADFDNYKKRIQRDMDSMVSSRRRMLLERLLPVLDNLERALQSNAGGDALRGGLEQTLRGFEAVLANEGVKPIEVRGEPFDPRSRRGHRHRACRRRRRRYGRRSHREGLHARRRLAASREGDRRETR